MSGIEENLSWKCNCGLLNWEHHNRCRRCDTPRGGYKCPICHKNDPIHFHTDLEIEQHEELSATQQKLEAAEARIKASQEQEPVAELESWPDDFREKAWIGNLDFPEGAKLYSAPIIPPDVADLRRENAELTRKLAEQQAIMRLASLAFDKTASEFRSGYLSGGSVETSNLRVEAWRAVANCDSAELTKLLAEAKSKAESNTNEGYPGIAHDFEYVKSLCKELRDCLFNLANRCDPEWGEVQDAEKFFGVFQSTLAAPQPETDRGSNE